VAFALRNQSPPSGQAGWDGDMPQAVYRRNVSPFKPAEDEAFELGVNTG